MNEMDLEFSLGSRVHSKVREPDAPLRVLVIGSFSAHTSASSFAVQKPLRIDVDNFDAVLAKFAPTLQIRLGEADTELAFASLDDFHPDELYRRVASFKDIEQHARSVFKPGDAEASETTESDASALERLLGSKPSETPAAVPTRPVGGIDLNAMIRDAIAPHITSGDDGAAQQLETQLDSARSIAMRELLHAAEFQALEAAWRGLHWLVFENNADEEALEISVLNVDRADLAQDLASHRGDLRGSRLYELLVTEAHGRFGGESYSAVIGNYLFDGDAEDISFLAALGAIATHAGAPFIGGAEPALLGGDSFATGGLPEQWRQNETATLNWHALRGCAQAASIGLVLPRIIGRLPYGGRGEEIEAFEFQELSTPPAHHEFLWLNGAFGCAKLIIEAFAKNAWSMEPGDVLDLPDLPAALYDTDEGPVLKASAETHLSRASAAHLLDQGLMAFMSHRDANVVRLARFQSVAEPATALAGPWR